MSRVLEYLHHVERTVGGIATGLTSPSAPTSFEGQPRARSRRQLPTDPLTTLTEDHQGVFLLNKLLPRFNIPAKFPNDIALFSRLETDGAVAWYAAALEADGENPHLSLANSLVLYKLVVSVALALVCLHILVLCLCAEIRFSPFSIDQGQRFEKQWREVTFGASALAVHEIDGWTYLVATERTSHLRAAPESGPVVYRLNIRGDQLIKVMTLPLETRTPSDVFFW